MRQRRKKTQKTCKTFQLPFPSQPRRKSLTIVRSASASQQHWAVRLAMHLAQMLLLELDGRFLTGSNAEFPKIKSMTFYCLFENQAGIYVFRWRNEQRTELDTDKVRLASKHMTLNGAVPGLF